MFLQRAIIISGLVIFSMGQIEAQMAPPSQLVTIPTAGSLQRGEYDIEILMQTGGGLLGRLGVGFTDRFSLGMSYGVHNFIGDEKPQINGLMPEAQLKYRLIDETMSMPAIALGVDSQGRGLYHDMEIGIDTTTGAAIATLARYDIKAIGAYVVASKNWNMLGNFGTHIGFSKNFWESDSADSDLNFFIGFDKELNPTLALYLEYNAALDDNDYTFEEISFGRGRGYLNAGMRLSMAPGLFLELDMNDIFINKGEVKYFSRELKVAYVGLF